MGKGGKIIKALFICVFFFSFFNPVDANLGGYTVEPMTPDMDPGTPLETVYVPFWELPPGEMTLVLVLSISPVLLFPLELLLFLKIFAYLGYRRIIHANVLDNTLRLEIYTYIKDNPGISFIKLAQGTDVKQGTLQYHLGILKITRKITALETSGNTRYFENTGKFSEFEKKIIRYLRNDTERSIFELLIRNPETTRKDLEVFLGISGAGVTWHMKRLSEENIITVTRIGRNARYIVNPEAMRFMEKYVHHQYEPGYSLR